MTSLTERIERIESAEGHWNTKEGHAVAVEYFDKTRADLALPHLSDFELANLVFRASRYDFDLIGYQTAARERIRWLSVQLAAALRARGEPA